jgi:type IV pilus assembly protein PilE
MTMKRGVTQQRNKMASFQVDASATPAVKCKLSMRIISEGNAMKKYTTNGFTLMEVMITVVIIGILAAIGYPNYIKYVTESRRSDATINLTRIAALQEKFFTECGFYAGTLGAARNCGAGTLAAGLGAGGATTEGHYVLAITNLIAGPTGVPGGGGYTLTATPTPGGLQATRDAAKCATLTITDTGAKDATGSDSPPGTNGGKCWKK